MTETYTDEIPALDEELRDAITRVNLAEGWLNEATDEYDKVRAELVEVILARGDRTATGINAEGEVFRATVVSGETTTVDDEALIARIGKRRYNALTVRKVSMKLVEEAVANGTLDVAVLAEVATVKARKTYPKLTRLDQ